MAVAKAARAVGAVDGGDCPTRPRWWLMTTLNPWTRSLRACSQLNFCFNIFAMFLAIFFFDGFAGDKMLTCAALFRKVPCIMPADIRHGRRFNLAGRAGRVILDLAAARRLSSGHLASPCQSLSMARGPPLRDLAHVYGLPGLKPHQQRLCASGTVLALWSARFLAAMDDGDAYASLENPLWSWIWFLFAIILI